MNFNEHIDHLLKIRDSIKLNEVTVLTGDNGTGKSLIRKLLWSHVNNLLGIDKTKSLVSDISMERRTGFHSEFGGLGFMLRDYNDSPTSMETYRFLKGILKMDEKRFIVLDEPEIGASKEVQKSFAKYINTFYDTVHNPDKCYGLLIITHSEIIVETLKIDSFINIQGLTKDEWLTREIKEIDLNKLEEYSSELFSAIIKRTSKK